MRIAAALVSAGCMLWKERRSEGCFEENAVPCAEISEKDGSHFRSEN